MSCSCPAVTLLLDVSCSTNRYLFLGQLQLHRPTTRWTLDGGGHIQHEEDERSFCSAFLLSIKCTSAEKPYVAAVQVITLPFHLRVLPFLVHLLLLRYIVHSSDLAKTTKTATIRVGIVFDAAAAERNLQVVHYTRIIIIILIFIEPESVRMAWSHIPNECLRLSPACLFSSLQKCMVCLCCRLLLLLQLLMMVSSGASEHLNTPSRSGASTSNVLLKCR